MSKIIVIIATAAIASALFLGNAALAKNTDEALDALQPKGHGPSTVLSVIPDLCVSACIDSSDQPVRAA